MKVAQRSLLVFLLLALLLWAGEPWKEKPYTEWTGEEVGAILLSSPWARVVTLQSFSTVRAPMVGPGPGTIDVAVPDQSIVQWASALTIRQAKLRAEQLQGTVSEERIGHLLSSPADFVVVVYVPRRPDGSAPLSFRDLDEATVNQSAYLKLKKSGQQIPASTTRFVWAESQPVAVEFRFPRELAGEPTILLGERKLTFSCELGKARIKTDFDLRKMVRDGKPDL